MTVAGDLLKATAEIVDGNRNTEHGNKERSFQTIANLWNEYLNAGEEDISNWYSLRPDDVCVMMTLLKIGRLCHGQPSKDHYMDAAGYMAIAYEVNGNDEW